MAHILHIWQSLHNLRLSSTHLLSNLIESSKNHDSSVMSEVLVVLQFLIFMFIPSLVILNCFVRFCRKVSCCYSAVNRMDGRGSN